MDEAILNGNKWIPCYEYLPPQGKLVLVFRKNKYIIVRYKQKKDEDGNICDDWVTQQNIVHKIDDEFWCEFEPIKIEKIFD